MNCTVCGTQCDEVDNFCRHCGDALHSEAGRSTTPVPWEFRDIVVPLNIVKWRTHVDPEHLEKEGHFLDQYNRRMIDQLDRLGQEGWQPAEITDFPTMWRRFRVEFRKNKPVDDEMSFLYESVQIRVKRLAH